jgi:cytohesin
MSQRELWSVQGKAKKSWKITLTGKTVTERLGRVGSAGKTKTKDFPSREAAQVAYDKLIWQRYGWGWFDKPDTSDPRTNLYLAVEISNVKEVRACLRQDPGTVYCPGAPMQPLHVAVRNGHAAVTRLLLEAGADINARDEEGKVPVLTALYEHDLEMFALLLEYKPDLTIADDLGMSPLKLCSTDADLAEFLQEHGVPPAADPTSRLIRALQTKGIKHVEREIAANPALARSRGMGDLAALVMHHAGARLIKLLLENGLDANRMASGGYGKMPLLQYAIYGDRPEIVQALLEHGANPNGKTKSGGPLLIEAWYGKKNRKAICDLLIQHGAGKDAKADLYFEGVLNQAIKMGSAPLVELLLKHGVNPNAHGRTKQAPLRLAVRHGKFAIVKLLLAHGADPNPEDVDTVEQGQPLSYEAQNRVLKFKGGAKIQDLLLAKGMEPMPET